MEKKAEKNMELKLMVFAIQDDEKFAIEHFGPINPVDDSLIEEALKLGFKESFAYSYSQAAKALLNWEEKDSGKSIVGGFRILNLDHILKNYPAPILTQNITMMTTPFWTFMWWMNFATKLALVYMPAKAPPTHFIILPLMKDQSI
nr:hypothetical protein [Bacteroidota bacterium]